MTRRRKKNWGDTYAAQVVVSYTPLGPVNHLKVRRHDGGTNRLTWDELMVIKNEMLGEDACAIELFPRDCDVVNSANIRHLWQLPEGFFRLWFGETLLMLGEFYSVTFGSKHTDRTRIDSWLFPCSPNGSCRTRIVGHLLCPPCLDS